MDLIKKSVALSWKNLILVVPFLIEAAIRFAVILPILILLAFIGFKEIDNMATTESYTELLVILGVIGFVFLVGYYVLRSFVLSGLFGMIKEVLEGKEPIMSQFFTYGKRYIWKAFWIQMIVYMLVFVLAIPLFFYFRAELLSPELMETIPLGLFGASIVYMLISMVLMLVAQFSILSVIRDDYSIDKAIGLSFKIMTKGFLDCLVLLGVFILLLLPIIVVFFVLNLIPAVGSFAFMALQYFLLVILLVWAVLFYDKYK